MEGSGNAIGGGLNSVVSQYALQRRVRSRVDAHRRTGCPAPPSGTSVLPKVDNSLGRLTSGGAGHCRTRMCGSASSPGRPGTCASDLRRWRYCRRRRHPSTPRRACACAHVYGRGHGRGPNGRGGACDPCGCDGSGSASESARESESGGDVAEIPATTVEAR